MHPSSDAVQTKAPIDWSQEIIYFILLDRFANGDTTNDDGGIPAGHIPFDPQQRNFEALKTYQGGDLAGVLHKLGYLDSLGVTTLWLSPVIDNADEDFGGWWPYHGYFPVDFYHVDEHFGTIELLRELVDQAHARDMKVILDMIYNHVAPSHPWVTDPRYWTEKGYQHWFHPHSGVDAATSIEDWQDQSQLENRELNGLPDLAQENPAVYDFLLDYSKYWIIKTGCDGFRLDAVKHVPKEFWQRLARDLHQFAGPDFLLLGEVFAGEVEYVASYQHLGFNALFDIPMYYTIQRVFAQGGLVTLLSRQLEANAAHYQNILLSPLIDNHDVARFSYYAGDHVKEKICLALTFVWSLNGLPMLYYGTETALAGAAPQHELSGEGQDYLNRLPFPWLEVKSEHQSLISTISRLNHVRRNSPALTHGSLYEIYQDYGVYAFLKYESTDARLVIVNNSTCSEERKFFLRDAIFAPDVYFTDDVSGDLFCTHQDTLLLKLKPLTGYILRASSPANTAHLLRDRWRCSFTPRLTQDLRLITLSYQSAQPLDRVSIAGDFNGWSAQANVMERTDSLHFQISIPLKRGFYRYKFVLNGSQWIADPAATTFELDPYGGKNSTLIVE